MQNKRLSFPAQESLLFMAILTAVGGYMNAYSFLTHGSFTSLHTGNMVYTGMYLAQGLWQDAALVLLPILGNIVGAFLAELLKRLQSSQTKRCWQRSTIIAQLIALFLIALLPPSVPSRLANWFLSVAAGFQLSNFRSCEGTVHNTTICTGNLRTVGQYLCTAVMTRTSESVVKLLRYAVAVFSFPFGAGVSVIITMQLGRFSAFVCCAGLAFLLWLLRHPEPSTAAAQ